MSLITTAPTGKLIQGRLLDADRRHFDRALKNYDKDLYTKWNPNKLNGWGCWEIRRKPVAKVPVDYGVYKENLYIRLDYQESDILHHVLDCAHLNYDQLNKIKSMDTWDKDHWIHNIDSLEQSGKQKEKEKAVAELKYSLKQNKSVFRDLMNLVRDGHSPGRILTDDN